VPEPSSAPSDGPSDEAAAAPAAEVVAEAVQFVPAEVSVPPGATVAWRNDLPIRHTVTAGTRDAPQPERFDMALSEEGQVVTATVTEETPYFCRIHAGMQGTIMVSR